MCLICGQPPGPADSLFLYYYFLSISTRPISLISFQLPLSWSPQALIMTTASLILLWLPNKILQMKWLKQQKFTSHSSGGQEVQDQGADQFIPWWELSSWSADSYLLGGPSHSRQESTLLSLPLLTRGPAVSLGSHPYTLT